MPRRVGAVFAKFLCNAQKLRTVKIAAELGQHLLHLLLHFIQNRIKLAPAGDIHIKRLIPRPSQAGPIEAVDNFL